MFAQIRNTPSRLGKVPSQRINMENHPGNEAQDDEQHKHQRLNVPPMVINRGFKSLREYKYLNMESIPSYIVPPLETFNVFFFLKRKIVY